MPALAHNFITLPFQRQAIDFHHIVEHAGKHGDDPAEFLPVEGGLASEVGPRNEGGIEPDIKGCLESMGPIAKRALERERVVDLPTDEEEVGEVVVLPRQLFELAVAVAISLYGLGSGAALATVVGVGIQRIGNTDSRQRTGAVDFVAVAETIAISVGIGRIGLTAAGRTTSRADRIQRLAIGLVDGFGDQAAEVIIPRVAGAQGGGPPLL